MAVFDGMPRDRLQGLLADAQAALIELQLGKKGVTFSYQQGDGAKAVTYRVSSVAELTALIMQLQIALGLRGPRRARPLVYQ